MKKQKRQHHLNNQQDNWCPEQRAHAVLQCGSHDNPWGNTRNDMQRPLNLKTKSLAIQP